MQPLEFSWLLTNLALCREEHSSAGTMFPPISRQHIPVQLRKHKPHPPPADALGMPSIHSTATRKHEWPSGVTMFDPSPRDNVGHGAPTAVRVDVGAFALLSTRLLNLLVSNRSLPLDTWLSYDTAGIAIPNAETVPAKGTYKSLDKDGITEIGTRHRGMSVRLSNERPANQRATSQ
eukprot:COSAG02_NODE_5024_length_4719_cov_13.040693_4_plen_177_part_00